MRNFISKVRGRSSAVALLAVAGVLGASGSAMATTTPDPVTSGTAGLQTGVDTMSQFLYAALPILLGLAIASAIVRWTVNKVKSSR